MVLVDLWLRVLLHCLVRRGTCLRVSNIRWSVFYLQVSRPRSLGARNRLALRMAQSPRPNRRRCLDRVRLRSIASRRRIHEHGFHHLCPHRPPNSRCHGRLNRLPRRFEQPAHECPRENHQNICHIPHRRSSRLLHNPPSDVQQRIWSRPAHISICMDRSDEQLRLGAQRVVLALRLPLRVLDNDCTFPWSSALQLLAFNGFAV